MNSLIRNPKDFWTGLFYLGIGLTAVFVAREYPLGTTLKMGPGYFPTALGGLLALIGAISLIRSFAQPGEPVGTFALKGLVLVTASMLLAGFLMRTAGLVVVLPLLVLISAYGSIKFRWGPALALAAGLTIFCTVVFAKGLGLPLPILGSWFGS